MPATPSNEPADAPPGATARPSATEAAADGVPAASPGRAPVRPAGLKAWSMPGLCLVCRQWGWRSLCSECDTRWAAPLARCARCAVPLSAPSSVCGACLAEAPPWQHAQCAVDYGFPWNGVLADFKFHGRAEHARLLAALMQRRLGLDGAAGRVTLVMPIQLDAARLRERGYNQAWELARRLARGLGLPATANGLRRRVAGAPQQAALPRRARLANLRGLFSVDPALAPRLTGQHVALVDDVMTTGATFHEATTMLREAGASAVSVWAFARTPPHPDERAAASPR